MKLKNYDKGELMTDQIARSAFVASLRQKSWNQITGHLFGTKQCEVCALGVGARVAQGLGYGLSLRADEAVDPDSDTFASANSGFYNLIRSTYDLNHDDTHILYGINDQMKWEFARISDALQYRFTHDEWPDEIKSKLGWHYA
jgi:hypothetical protein